ncbi:hypothetical protein [Pseudogemmobacter bohemicus]|uniref:hypothetical protein n=1 Tax=Pseudogemmobacter bohemicus TaxID=2250708 RepID=UPI000DD45C07|nr:hypothetical protein [Pseudogemmobacter bohemicus]
MNTYTLADIAAKFARLDAIEDDTHAQFEKGLRNLVQRHFLPPTSQQGRVFLYDAAAAVTIRFAQIAAEFGLPRPTIDTLARWLSGSGERTKKQGSGFRGVLRSEEAIDRVEAGETFAVHIVMRADGSVTVKSDWQTDRGADDRVRNAALSAGLVNVSPEVARFSLPASRLIAEILPLLKG